MLSPELRTGVTGSRAGLRLDFFWESSDCALVVGYQGLGLSRDIKGKVLVPDLREPPGTYTNDRRDDHP